MLFRSVPGVELHDLIVAQPPERVIEDLATIFQGAVDVLFDGDYITAKEMMQAFNDYGIYLSQKDLEDIMGLKSGTLNIGSKVISFVKPKIDIGD